MSSIKKRSTEGKKEREREKERAELIRYKDKRRDSFQVDRRKEERELGSRTVPTRR